MRVLPVLAVLTFFAGVAMLVVGYFFSGDSKAAPPPVTYFTAVPTNTPTAPPTDAPSPTPTPPPYNGAVARLQIPRFKVDSAIEPLTVMANNELATPTNPRDTGWYDSTLKPDAPYLGAKPGFGGNAVFAAHVDYYGLDPSLMPFNKLPQLNEKDEVDIVMDNGATYRYAVISKQNFNISDIKMGEIIDAKDKPPGAEWITLITCGNTGAFVYVQGNSGPVEYLTRDVVVAQRIS
jgi:hypothetical protein